MLLRFSKAQKPSDGSGEGIHKSPCFTVRRPTGFFLLLFVLLPSFTSAFDLIIDEGVNESMVELVLSRIPANATIDINKIHFHADGCKDIVCRYHENKANTSIAGTYHIKTLSYFTGNLKADIDIYHANETSIYSIYSTLQHELGHHNDARLNGFEYKFLDFSMLKVGEEYRKDPAEIYANNFRLLPKCGCDINYCYTHSRSELTTPITPKKDSFSERSAEKQERTQGQGKVQNTLTSLTKFLAFLRPFHFKYQSQDRSVESITLSLDTNPYSDRPVREASPLKDAVQGKGGVLLCSPSSLFSEEED